MRYHILTDGQHEMLQTKYGLTGNDPYRFVVYEQEFPLSGELKTALEHQETRRSHIRRQQDGTSCKAVAHS